MANKKEMIEHKTSLLPPSQIDVQAYNDLIDEYRAANEMMVPSELDQGELNFADYIKHLEDVARGLNLPEGWVPASTYFLADESGYLLGAVNIRHELNEFLRTEGGHIGYGIRPSQRSKGYGTKILAFALEKTKKLNIPSVLVICDKDNTHSAAVIRKNGGLLASEIEIDGQFIQRYWINT